MQLIGLTGPSGAGKSTVAAHFAAFGIPVLDADAIYHELLLPPSDCLCELSRHFGKEILLDDGSLNRRRLASRVFADKAELEALNQIAHRHVMQEVHRRLQDLRNSEAVAAILDAPQLFESGANRDCSAVVSVLANAELRLGRILARDGISREEALDRMRSQNSDRFFIENSDYVIENNGDPNATQSQVRAILLDLGVIS